MATRKGQPEYRKVNHDGIHPKLKEMKAWACWKSIPNPSKEKPDKIPYSCQINPLTGQEEVKLADCTRPETWMAFENAMRLLKSSASFKGLQLALLPMTPENDKDRLIGLDLDNAILPDGNIKPEYREWIAKFNTWFELSPGNGIRGFCFGHFKPEAGKHSGDIEIYQERKWLTVTGNKITDSAEGINNTQEVIDEFRARYFKPYYEIDTSDLPVTNVTLTDDEIIARLEHGSNEDLKEQFKHYFYTGAIGNHSDDDFHLCCMIRFWTQDEEQIDRIFRRSALMRGKWDEMRGSITYGEMTIRNALGCRTSDTPIYMFHTVQPLPKEINWPGFELAVGNFRVDCTGIYYSATDREGNESEILISGTPCVITAKGINRDTGELNYKILISDGAYQEHVIWRRGSGLLKKNGVLELMESGLEFQETDYSLINKYFFNFIDAYRTSLPMEIVVSSSGWKDGYTEFVVGGRVISNSGVAEIIQIDNEAVKMFGHKGTAEEWAKGVDGIIQFKPTRFKAYSALGCLLIRKSDSENFIFDQCCGTTRLKSFTNRLVASMIGHPKKQQLSAKSTALGIDKIAAACNDLPVFLDETSENVAFVEELVYRFGNANTRVKSNLSSGLEMSDNYSSGLFLTGEDSIITENSKGGHHARRVPETHGVPEDKDGKPVFVSLDVKNKVQKAMNNNFGNIIILFIQELLPIIHDIDEIVADNFKRLPDTGTDAVKGRLKGYYAVILTAGEILEKVFAKLGMTPCNPFEIVERYFRENVMNNATDPDYVKFLRIAYDMYVSDKAHFGATANSEFAENEKIDLLSKYGWVDKKGDTVIINYRPQALRECVLKAVGGHDAANRYETSLNQWQLQGILNPTVTTDKKTDVVKIKNTKQIRTALDDRQYVIQIPLEQFYKHLNLEDGPSNPDEAKETDLEEVNNEESNDVVVAGSNANLYEMIMDEMGGVN